MALTGKTRSYNAEVVVDTEMIHTSERIKRAYRNARETSTSAQSASCRSKVP
jgi:hypothetical protein